jgi:hypothetical protein
MAATGWMSLEAHFEPIRSRRAVRGWTLAGVGDALQNGEGARLDEDA